MTARAPQRAVLAGVTLTAAVLIGIMLWQNVSKRKALKADPVKAAANYPDYAPALIKANDRALSAYATRETREKIAAGELVFSQTEHELIKMRAKSAFASAPLTVEAITQIATADFLHRQNWADRGMLLLAKSRNARDRQTLSALSFMDLRAGNFKNLLDNYDLMHRLGSLEDRDLEIIQALSALDEQRGLVESALASDPEWGEDYFRAVIPKWTREDIEKNRKSLFIFLEAQDDSFVRTTLLNFYFLQLKRLSLYSIAREDWDGLPEVAVSGAKTGPVYNPDFKNITAPQPFNWRTYEPDLALAEIETSGGLYASSSAPKRALIAQQLTTAPTGKDLKLSVDGRWQYREQQGFFFLRLSCMPARAPFFDIIIGDSGRADGRVSADIKPLPEGCEYQDLQLYAEPGGFNQRVSLNLARIDITSVGGGQ